MFEPTNRKEKKYIKKMSLELAITLLAFSCFSKLFFPILSKFWRLILSSCLIMGRFVACSGTVL